MGEDRHHGHVQLVVHLVKILVMIVIIIVIILVIIVEIIVVFIAVTNFVGIFLSIHTYLTVSVAKLKSSYSREIFLRFFLITTQKPSSR